MEIDGLPFSLDQIAPNDSGKYSPNLHAWVKRTGKKYGAKVFQHRGNLGQPFSLAHDLVIGQSDRDGWVYGWRLANIVAQGKAKKFAWGMPLVDVSEQFWTEYLNIGRCIWDHTHTIGMIDDESRYTAPVDGQKTCNWCGTTLHKHIKIIEQVSWRVTPPEAEASHEEV